MKKFLAIFLCIFLTSCSFLEKNDTNKKENKLEKEIISEMTEEIPKENEESDEKVSEKSKNTEEKIEYRSAANPKLKEDESLFVNKMLVEYPAKLESSDSAPYSKEDFKNLDYSKDVSFCMENFRIPSKAKIYVDQKENYLIDFPKSGDYIFHINFSSLFNKEDLEKNFDKLSLKDIANYKTAKMVEKDKLKLIQKPLSIKSDYKDAFYSIVEDDLFRHTYLFVNAPNDIIFFDFVEEKEKSNFTPFVMADLLSTMYIDSEDPMFVKKSFKDYKDYLNLYTTEKVDIDQISLQIPNTMKKLQANNAINVYIDEKKDDIVTEIIFTSFDKKSDDLETAFDKISGENIPPAYIVGMGESKQKKIKDLETISSKARIYTESYSLEGYKTTVETENKFITIMVLGPLENINQTSLLNNNILNTLEFR